MNTQDQNQPPAAGQAAHELQRLAESLSRRAIIYYSGQGYEASIVARKVADDRLWRGLGRVNLEQEAAVRGTLGLGRALIRSARAVLAQAMIDSSRAMEGSK